MSHRRAPEDVHTFVSTVSSVPRAPKKPRTIRVSDDLWRAAGEEASRRGEYVSEAIVRFLRSYTAETGTTGEPDAD